MSALEEVAQLVGTLRDLATGKKTAESLITDAIDQAETPVDVATENAAKATAEKKEAAKPVLRGIDGGATCK